MSKNYTLLMSQPKIQTLKRPRVIRALIQAVQQSPLVVISAPMGYGKTTAVRSLESELPQHYYHIEVPDGLHNEVYLWEIACLQLIEQHAHVAEILQRMGFPKDSIELHRMLNKAQEHFDSLPTVIVIDDYHYAKAPAMDAFLEALVRKQIPDLTIVIVSRTRPSIGLEDLQIKGLAQVFTQDFLAFTPKETSQYFNLHGVSNPTVAQKSWTFSQGWPAATFLSYQSYQASGNVSPESSIENLISETIFSSYSLADKQFLLELSILDSFTPMQAVALTNDKTAPKRLRQLQNKNAFLQCAPYSNVCQLHSIFRTYLQNLFTELTMAQASSKDEDSALPQIDATQLYRRASELAYANDKVVDAISFLFKAGQDEDMLRILEMLSKPSDGLYVMYKPEEMYNCITAIPSHIRSQCPIGYLAFVYHYMSRVNMEKGKELLMQAVDKFFSEPLPPDILREVKGEVELIKGLAAFNDLFTMKDLYYKAHSLLQKASSISHPQLVWTMGSPHAAFLYLREAGTYSKLVKLVENNLHCYQGITKGCSAGGQSIFRAEYLLETDKLTHVNDHLDRALYKAQKYEQLASVIATVFTRARCFVATGQPNAARKELASIAPLVTTNGHPVLMNSLDLCIGYIASILNDKDSIPHWLQHGEIPLAVNFYQCSVFTQIVHGKALLLTEQWTKLDALMEEVPIRLTETDQLFARIHVLTMQAIAQFHLTTQQRALKIFDTAITLSRPDKIITTLAEYGCHLLPLLSQLRDWKSQDVYYTHLIKATKRYATYSIDGGIQLTPREQSVLERLLKGHKNKRIAEDLDLTPGSVANILTRIYGKLGVTSRNDAIVQWGNTSQEDKAQE